MKRSRVGIWTTMLCTLGMASVACLSRPVGQQPPTTKVNFTSTVSQQAVDKVDLLFAIDNSASMGDKQQILSEAVPDLLQGLLKPRCGTQDANGNFIPNADKSLADPAGKKENHYGCPTGDPEFKPVIDMHIGIVSSSLGNFGGDVCDSSNPRTDDRAHLLNLNKQGGGVPDAKPGNFLAWQPQADENNNKDRHPDPPNGQAKVLQLDTLSTDFAQMVTGIEQTGCGLEAQLESVYRFLIQPDPWDVIKLDGANQADLGDGIDGDVIQQRADFLRPDSLVAIIMLSDEDDSSVDPLSVAGQGWAFMAKEFPGSRVFRVNSKQGTTAPRGTTKCDTDPASDDCTSCGFATLCDPNSPACQRIKQDGNCKQSGLSGQNGDGFNGYYPGTDDELNVRFFHMKQRYGIDPQYPIKRYIDGLTKFKVPDRNGEHTVTKNGDKRSIASYVSVPKCTNPLFAAALPRDNVSKEALCGLPLGTRSPDLVFFAVVGGVPNQLLYPAGYDPNDQSKNRTTNDRWIKILGRDPVNFNYDGIDAHMIQSIDPRPGLTGQDLPRGNNGQDAINGREWITNKADLQYACTFPLPDDKQRTCNTSDQSCDCTPDDQRNPPLCNGPAPSGNKQVRAKAYPTVREFEVVRALGDQGIAASLCPIQLTDKNGPDYGYRPAVASIIDRLKNALTTQCLPQRLRQAAACDTDKDCPDGEQCTPEKVCTTKTALNVPCLVLAQLKLGEKCEQYGLDRPPADILAVFLEQQKAETGTVVDGGVNFAALDVCVVPQAAVAKGESCVTDSERHWCYVENDPATGKRPARNCPQALLFSNGTTDIQGARFSLQCIQQFGAGEAAGDQSKK